MSLDLFGNPCPPFPASKSKPIEYGNEENPRVKEAAKRAKIEGMNPVPEPVIFAKATKKQDRQPMLSRFSLAVVHYVGAFVLAGFNVLFFLSLAPDRILERVLFAVTGAVFAFGEVGLWERGVWTHKLAPKLCALGLAVFSFLSAAAVSMQEVSAYQGNVDAIASIESEIQESEEESRILRERIAAMPSNYATRAETLNRELDTKATNRNALRARIDALRANGKSEAKASGLFVAISGLFGLSVQSVALIFLVARSAMIEVVTLASSPKPIRNDSIKKD